jgi:Protein of unknown function (DUF2752)
MSLSLDLPAPLSPLFRQRSVAVGLLGLATVQLGLFWLGLPGWPCPFLKLFGVPCPGCGLTRAIALLALGDFHAALAFHAFAPLFLIGIVLSGISGVLPQKTREPLIDKLELIERRTGLSVIILAGLVVYWLARLLLFHTAFVRLIRG